VKTAFIYSDAYFDYDYGETHPLKVYRLKLAYELIRSYGLLEFPSVLVIPTRRAEDEELVLFHGREYLDALKQASEGKAPPGSSYRFGLGPGDNPVFKGVYEWSQWVTGATLQAAELVGSGERDIAFNIAGGLHHADPSRASGFCYINDGVIGIIKLLKQGNRVAYVDFDAHHGDGVQRAFFRTDRVLTVSLHEAGYSLFPGTGYEHEIGEGQGRGYSVNVPFPPFADDDVYLWAFERIVPPLLERFQPDVVVTQLGVDSFYTDPLANLHLSIQGFEAVVRRMKELAPRWVALGGGGYDVSNVARAWTVAWAVMNGIELSDELPPEYVRLSAEYGISDRRLRAVGAPCERHRDESVREEVERIVKYLTDMVFPLIKAGSV
jgi:acetoin utilization protein AcuC